MDYKNILAEYDSRLTAAYKEACATREELENRPVTDLPHIWAEATAEAFDKALRWLDEATANAAPIEFASREHRTFFHKMLITVGKKDCCYAALFYTLGILDDTRLHINDLYDFKNGGIKTTGLSKAWQTSGSYNACLLAFNLYNGYTARTAEYSTPSELFEGCDSSLSRYMLEAIKIRHSIH